MPARRGYALFVVGFEPQPLVCVREPRRRSSWFKISGSGRINL